MKERDKTKEQRVDEKRVAELQMSEVQHKRKERNVQETLEYAEGIINTVRDPLIILDQDLRVVTASRSFYDFFKVRPEETEGQFIYDLGNKQWDIPRLRELLETILPEKATFDNYEVEHVFATIGRRIMLLNARQIQRTPGKERIILLAIEDITDHKLLENLLTESEERYRRIFENAVDGIVLLEKREGKIIHANTAAGEMLGYSLEDSVGKKLQNIGIVDIDSFQTIMQILDEIGVVHYTDVSIETKSGEYIDTDIYLVDKAILVQCNIHDISQRKQIQEALRESEEKHRLLFDSAGDAIFVVNSEARIMSVNQLACERTGYTHEELTSMTLDQLDSPAETPKVPDRIAQLMDHGHLTFETVHQCKDGSLIPTEVNARRTTWDGQPAIMSICRDITSRKLLEAELEEWGRTLAELVSNLPGMVCRCRNDRDWTMLYISPGCRALTGYDPDDLLGNKRISFNDLVLPEYREHLWEKWQEALSARSKIEYEYPIRSADGDVRWVWERGQGLFNNDGELLFLECYIVDITSRKKAEEELAASAEKLRKNLVATIEVISMMLEARDPYTAGHQRRVSRLARSIAQEMGLSAAVIDNIRMAGNIHDIGKMSVPAEILSKPARLSDIEMQLMKVHPQTGYDILKVVDLPSPIAEIVLQHHERLDGSGYPRGLKDGEILLEAQIMAVADVVEAMASHRPYRPALGLDATLEEVEKNSGILYNSGVVDACLKLFRENGFKFETTT